MAQRAIPAVFMRGGTSKGLMFHERDLPRDRAEWVPLLCGAMGSPDQFGRQLDGMGGGISSLSKVCVIGPPTHDDADLDYTFVQVMIAESRLDLRSNCGNMSAAVGPFAYDEGLVRGHEGRCDVLIHNTNTNKIIRSSFAVGATHARYDGEFRIPGVSAGGSPVRLDFLDPGGASTGRLLPTGRPRETIEVAGGAIVTVSMVDAANAVVFVNAHSVGLKGDELPGELDENPELLDRLEAIRREASVRMGIAPDVNEAARVTGVPFVCLLSPPAASATLSGATIAAGDADLVARAISHGQPHRALPLTVALCTAVAARIDGSVVAAVLNTSTPAASPLRVAMPSGVLEVDSSLSREGTSWAAHSGTFYRTARRLFDGRVWSNY